MKKLIFVTGNQTKLLDAQRVFKETKPNFAYDKWKFAAYNVDQRPSGPKMKNRFSVGKEFYLPASSLHLKKE